MPAAGRFVSGRDVADVWAAEGCAFKTTCNTYARFSVPGAANTAGRKSGSVAVDTRGAAVTAAWPAGSVSARYLDEWFGCQLSFSSAQARAPALRKGCLQRPRTLALASDLRTEKFQRRASLPWLCLCRWGPVT